MRKRPQRQRDEGGVMASKPIRVFYSTLMGRIVGRGITFIAQADTIQARSAEVAP